MSASGSAWPIFRQVATRSRSTLLALAFLAGVGLTLAVLHSQGIFDMRLRSANVHTNSNADDDKLMALLDTAVHEHRSSGQAVDLVAQDFPYQDCAYHCRQDDDRFYSGALLIGVDGRDDRDEMRYTKALFESDEMVFWIRPFEENQSEVAGLYWTRGQSKTFTGRILPKVGCPWRKLPDSDL